MATFIPFEHPSLVLGRVVDGRILQLMSEIGAAQTKTDAALDKMNSLIAMRRGLEMTINELVSLDVDITELTTRIRELNDSIAAAARDYMTARIANDNAIQASREKLTALDVDDDLDSPVDFLTAKIQYLPLASDSIRLDMQYFSYGKSGDASESSVKTVMQIEDAIRKASEPLGSQASELAKAASSQINQQRKVHDLSGTLVITATCTHRNTAMIVPLTLDADRMLAIWNELHGGTDVLDTSDLQAMRRAAVAVKTDAEAKNIPLLVGVNYGSSFVGLVHTINEEEVIGSQSVDDMAGLEDRARLGNWLSDMAGQFGMDAAVSEQIHKLVGTKSVSSHVNIIVMGAVPSFTSQAMDAGVNKVLASEAQRGAQQLAAVKAATGGTRETQETGSHRARMGNQLLNMQSQMMQGLIHTLGQLDQATNKALDINSLMAAFENYIKDIKAKDKDGAVGVPIGFQIRRITSSQVARTWLDKYFPEQAPRSAQAAATSPAGQPLKR